MPEKKKKVLVVGASGVIGQAALRHFSRLPEWRAVGVSRRPPVDVPDAELLSVDLTDRAACEAALGQMHDVTHIVYAAVYEKAGGLVGGATLDLRFSVAAGAHGLITRPGATRFTARTVHPPCSAPRYSWPPMPGWSGCPWKRLSTPAAWLKTG